MWTDTTRAQYARADLALPSDSTDAEWALLEPSLPPPSHVGRPRKWPLRRIVEAILYLLRGGLPWRMLPPCFPPVSTVRRWFYLWRDSRLWLSLNHALLLIGREATGRDASPSAGVIDSQSVKTTESGGPRGYDAGKKIKGRKRHILTDTEGNLVHAVIHTADIQDRDGAPLVLAEIIKRFPWLRHVFADGGYAGDKLRQALRRIGKWTLEIVKRSDTGFRGPPAPLGRRADAGMAESKPPTGQGLRANHRVSNRMAVHRLDPALRTPHRKAMNLRRIILNQALKRHGSPEAITTDGLRSYRAAMKELGNEDKQEVGRWANNRCENSHLSFRRRERAMLRFRQMKALQKFASVHANVHNHFALERHLID